MKITYKEPRTTVTIDKSIVSFIVDMPLTIKKGDNTMTVQLKDLPIKVNSSLYEILEVANYITNSHKENPDRICITCIAEMAEERNLYVDMFAIPGNSILTVI